MVDLRHRGDGDDDGLARPTVVASALPTLLHSAIDWVGWTVTTYQLGQVIAMPVAGRISDQFGRKRVFVTCVVLFAASSLMCGLSDNIQILIVSEGSRRSV